MESRDKGFRYYPLLGALSYLVLGFLLITFSDLLLSTLVSDPATLTRYQSYKGYVYVLLTAGLAWVLLQQRLQFARSFLQSEYVLEQTIARAAAGIAHVNADGQFIRVNDELCNLLGYSATELLTMRFQQLTHPMDLSRDQELLHEVLQGRRQSYTLEKRYLHNNWRCCRTWLVITTRGIISARQYRQRNSAGYCYNNSQPKR